MSRPTMLSSSTISILGMAIHMRKFNALDNNKSSREEVKRNGKRPPISSTRLLARFEHLIIPECSLPKREAYVYLAWVGETLYEFAYWIVVGLLLGTASVQAQPATVSGSVELPAGINDKKCSFRGSQYPISIWRAPISSFTNSVV